MKKLDAQNLFQKIQNLARERMRAKDVLVLDDLKSLRHQKAPRILVIEDDEFVRRSLQRLFEHDKYRVVLAQDATELSQVVETFLFDLILLDVGLPWINGFELAELLKEHDDLKRIPIVFISGHGDHDMIKKGFAVGADDYITKPFDLEKVRKTVRTLLELYS